MFGISRRRGVDGRCCPPRRAGAAAAADVGLARVGAGSVPYGPLAAAVRRTDRRRGGAAAGSWASWAPGTSASQ